MPAGRRVHKVGALASRRRCLLFCQPDSQGAPYTRWFPAAALAFLLGAVATVPAGALQPLQNGLSSLLLRLALSDPFQHALTAALLALLLARAVRSLLGAGLLIELYQALLPWRAFGLDDLYWNAAGAALALALLAALNPWQPKNDLPPRKWTHQ